MLDRLIDFLIGCLELLKFWQVVPPYDEGVQIRLGKFHRVLGCGLYFILPFGIDHCLVQCVVPSTHSLGDESATTKDGKSIGFNAVITYQIRDIKKALLEIDHVENAVKDACSGEIGRVMRESAWAEVMAPDMPEKLTSACRRRGFRFGIEVMSVQLAGLALVRSIRLMQK